MRTCFQWNMNKFSLLLQKGLNRIKKIVASWLPKIFITTSLAVQKMSYLPLPKSEWQNSYKILVEEST